MGWTPEQITQILSWASIILTMLIGTGSLILGIFNYRNTRQQTASGLNEDLSEIAEREARGRREIQQEFFDYKKSTDEKIEKLESKVEELSGGEYELRTVITVGKKPAIKSNEVMAVKSRSKEMPVTQ